MSTAQTCTMDVAPPSVSSLQDGPNVRIFNVKYSPNLGDGLLSECLEGGLARHGAAQARSIDLAGRTAYSNGTAARKHALQLLHALPSPLRREAVRLPLALASRRTWAPHYAAQLEEADAVVIGGGNLLADMDLNFPTKLALAIESAARRDLPIFLYGLGVSPGWSKEGRARLHRALRCGQVRRVWVRDARSRELWQDLAGDAFGLAAGVVRDPGLLAARQYGVPERAVRDMRPSAPARIGLNVMSALAVAYHGGQALTEEALDAWYLALGRDLLARGYHLSVFSNGSPEDRAAVERLRLRFELAEGPRRVAFPEIRNPGDLVACICDLDGLVAFRMHAIIAAYSCAVPFLALAWDAKLDAFLASVECSDHLADIAHTSPGTAAERVAHHLAQGIAPATRRATLEEAEAGIATLAAAIREALAPAPR
ncbi:MAG: polysaccharide pyruvyl transferase family protein [Pseudomonadota bacterium]|nr:polysaccharide pyruvyl transferase family protein [Pseudomonadota bacterium]